MTSPPFTAIAAVYDEIMADVDYAGWCDFILREARARGYRGGSVLDLGCGTGTMVLEFKRRGITVTGLDGSEAMLAQARAKAPDLEWVRSGFTDFSLDATFELVYSAFDSLNNLLGDGELAAAFARVHAHLRPGGLFLFDVNTSVGLADLWEGQRVEGWAGGVHYLWRHEFDEGSGLARVEATWTSGGQSHAEVHFERPYDEPELRRLLAEAGFGAIAALDYPSGDPPETDAERIWMAAKRPLGGG